jgi:hypothetical protein
MNMQTKSKHYYQADIESLLRQHLDVTQAQTIYQMIYQKFSIDIECTAGTSTTILIEFNFGLTDWLIKKSKTKQ